MYGAAVLLRETKETPKQLREKVQAQRDNHGWSSALDTHEFDRAIHAAIDAAKNAQLNWARHAKRLFCEPTHETRPGKQSFALPRQTSSLVSNVNYGTLQRIPAHTRHFSLHGSLGCKDEAPTVSLECTADTECKSGELCMQENVFQRPPVTRRNFMEPAAARLMRRATTAFRART